MLSWIEDYISYVEKHKKDFNKYIKANIAQIKELLKRKTIIYEETDPIACEKLSRLFVHTEGEFAGKNFELNMEQKYIIACLLGIKEYSKEKKCYLRYFTELNLFVARKWGKDHLTAILAAYFLGIDKEPSAWGQILAENSSQSLRTFEIVEKEIQHAPLNQVFKKVGSKEKKQIIFEYYDNIKKFKYTGKLEYLSGRIKGKDGSNPSFAIINEAHEITNFNQYTAMKSAFGSRKQPMMIVISSAGVTPQSLYESLLERNREFLRKKKLAKDERVFALMYGLDDEDDINDESCWIKANPAMYENRPTLKFLKEQWASMKSDPILKNTFISKHLNRQLGAVSAFYDMTSIKKCIGEIKKEEFYNTYATGGVDLASTTDLCNATAKILLPNGKSIILQAYFIASECLENNSKKDNQDYKAFEQMETENEITANLVIITQGNTVSFRAVTQWFVHLRDNYNITFLKIGYDKAMADYWKADMAENGFPHEKVEFDRENRVEHRDYGILTPCYQGKGLDQAIRVSKNLLELNKYKIDINNKLLPYCFWNIKVTADNDNKLSVSKLKSTGHIDGCIGLFNSEIAYNRAKEIYQYVDAEEVRKLFE